MTVKIAFFGAYGSFDCFKIGGTESFARRLAGGLIQQGHQADFVVYGAPNSFQGQAGPGIRLSVWLALKEALAALSGYDHVITIYVHAGDRLCYLRFRRRARGRLRFHQVYFVCRESPIRRKLAFLDARLYPFNGRLFCISPRLLREVERWSARGALLLPPVPEAFFLAPEDKPRHEALRVNYIGRTEPGKGIETVIALFTLLKNHPQVQLAIYGYYHPNSTPSVQVHEELSRQTDIPYFYTPYASYTPQVDEKLRRLLMDTDILVLPYQRISSTIDTPLLLLEGMASLCAVATRPLGDIPATYGAGPFIINNPGGIEAAATAILGAREVLEAERRRVKQQRDTLGFSTNSIVDKLISALS
jgi:glycosyltransferase involved in cell wall biosynthesis